MTEEYQIEEPVDPEAYNDSFESAQTGAGVPDMDREDDHVTFEDTVDKPITDSYDVAAVASKWSRSGSAYFPVEETVHRLPPGQYTVDFSHSRGIFFRRKPVSLDKLIILPDSSSEEIIVGIESFWDKEKVFKDLGFLWKRGVLLCGPPGGGKTSTLQLIASKIIKRGGITVYVRDPQRTAEGLEVIRRIEPDRPIVVMIEDFDAIQDKYGENDLLAMLDGDLQIDNVVFIATTNYPENLDARIINRPSRFDVIKRIGMPSREARKVYLEATNPRIRGTQELEEWLDLSKEYSIAHLKEMIVSVEALDQNLHDVVERLDAMIHDQPSSDDTDDEQDSLGFSSVSPLKAQAAKLRSK